MTIRVTDSSTGPGSYFELEPFTLTVSPPPSVSIAVAPASVSEDGAINLTYTVTRSLNLSSSSAVNITTSGTATSGTDYTGGVATVVIPAGATTATITINPTVDGTVEVDETVILTVAAGAGYTVGAPAGATGTILNDDVPSPTITSVSPGSGPIAGGTVVTITGTNFTGATSVSFGGAPATSFTVDNDSTITAVSRPAAPGPVSLVVAVGSRTASSMFTYVAPPSASIAASPASVSEDGATNLIYTVTLSQASPAATSVNFNVGGTATNGTDYATITSPLVIPAGSTTATITVNPTADATIEADETVTVTLAAGTGYTVGTPSSATGTILNDDLPNLTINDVTGNEGGAGPMSFSFTVSLSAPAGPGGVTFDIATANGSATAGFDYEGTALTGRTIPAGSSTYTFTVTIGVDGLNEPTETFFVNVTNVTGAVVVDGQGVGTITDDDPLPSLSINDVTVTEGNSGTTNAVFTVTLSASSGQNVTVNYATADGTATQPADYTNTSGTLTFTPGQTTRTVTVPVVGDAVAEANESYFVNLSGATNATISDNQGLGTITNDDLPPTANAASLTVAYNAAATNAPLNITGGAATSVAIGTAAAHGTAIATGTTITYQPTAGYAGSDSFTYTATNGAGTSAPATVTVTVNDPVVTITASGGFAATVAAPYTQTFTFNGGAQPWSGFQVTNLPAGLSISGTTANTVTVSGTPRQAGSFNLNVSATDSSTGNGPYTVGQAFALTVAGPTLALTPAATTFNAPYSAAYSQSFTASGGVGPYTYALTGALPAGLSFAGNTVSGTPTVPGSFSFTITATDAGASGTGSPFTVAQNYTVAVATPTIIVNPATVPNPVVATAYSQTVTASGGTAPYGFTVSAGSLPTGVNLATGGALGGTPTAGGTFNFTITATDNFGQTGARAYTVAIAVPTIVLPAATLASGVAASPYSAAIGGASGGTAPYSYAVTAGALPGSLTLSTSTGAITGTPSAAGTFNFSITATDSSTGTGPYTATRAYSISVGQAAQTIAFTNPGAQTFVPNGQIALTATGGASGNAIVFTSDTTAVCTVAGATATMLTAGACTITANQAGNANYAAAAAVTQSFAINQIPTTTTLSASSSSIQLGQPITFTATVTQGTTTAASVAAQSLVAPLPAALTGGVTFTSGATTLCANVPLANNQASCTTTFTTPGAQSIVASYSGGGSASSSASTVTTMTVDDQRVKTVAAISKFMGARNNQLLSNEPDGNRQIDRLGQSSGAGGGGDAGAGFASGRGSAPSATVPGTRLGAGPDAADLSRFRFGGRDRQRDEATVAVPPPFGAGNGATEEDRQSGSASGPMRMSGSTDGAMRFGFATSLSQMRQHNADTEAKKLQNLEESDVLGLKDGVAPRYRRVEFNPFDVWAEGKYTSFRDTRFNNGTDGHFGVVSLGADYVLRPWLLIGAMVQFDSMQQRSDTQATDVSGRGWMAGPYATFKLSDQVFWQARAAWGRSSNEVSPLLTYTDKFDSERWLVSSTLTGNYSDGPWQFRPSASIAYIEDVAASYADHFGTVIPGVTNKLGQAKAGPEIGYRYEARPGLVIEPRLGAQVIWNFAGGTTVDGAGQIAGENAGPEGVRGRAEVGIRAGAVGGISVDLSGSYDGIGSDGYHATTGRAMLRVPLN